MSSTEIELLPEVDLALKDEDAEPWIFADETSSRQDDEQISLAEDGNCIARSDDPPTPSLGFQVGSVDSLTLTTTCVLRGHDEEGQCDPTPQVRVEALQNQYSSDINEQLSPLPPDATVETDDIDLYQLIRILEHHKDNSAQCHQQDVVIVLGNTGAGKSLTVNYLCGRRIVLSGKASETECIDVQNPLQGCIVCHLGDSQTKYLSSYMDSASGLVFCDTPGFEDTEGSTVDVANSVAIAWTIRSCSSIRIILLIEAHLIANQKGKEFKGLIRLIQRFIDEADFASVLPLFTHCAETSPKKILQHLERFMKASHFSDARPFLVHIVDMLKQHGDLLMLRPAGSRGKKQLPQIRQLISGMSPIIDTCKYVKSPLGEDSKTSLKLACKALACRIERSFRLRNPAATHKHDLDSLKLLSHALGICEISSQYLNICEVLTEQATSCCHHIKEAFYHGNYVQAGNFITQLEDLESLGEHLCEGHAEQSRLLYVGLNESIRTYLGEIEAEGPCKDFRLVRERLDALKDIQTFLGNSVQLESQSTYDKAISAVASLLEKHSSSALNLIDRKDFASGTLNVLLGQLIQVPILCGHFPESMQYEQCISAMQNISRDSCECILRNLDSRLDVRASAEIAANFDILTAMQALERVHVQGLEVQSEQCLHRLEEVTEDLFLHLDDSLAQHKYEDVSDCLEQLKTLEFRNEPNFSRRCSTKLDDITRRLKIETDSIDKTIRQQPSSEEYAQFVSSLQSFHLAFNTVGAYLKSDVQAQFLHASSRWMRHVVQIHDDLLQKGLDDLGLTSGTEANAQALASTLMLMEDVLQIKLHFETDTERIFAKFCVVFVCTLRAKGRRCVTMAKISDTGKIGFSLEKLCAELKQLKQFLSSLQQLQSIGKDLVYLFHTSNRSENSFLEDQDVDFISQYICDVDLESCDDRLGPAIQQPVTTLESFIGELERYWQLSVKNIEEHSNVLAEQAKVCLLQNKFAELKALMATMSGFSYLESLLNISLTNVFAASLVELEQKFGKLMQMCDCALQANKMESAYELLYDIHRMLILEDFVKSSKDQFGTLCAAFQKKAGEFGMAMQNLFDCRKFRKLSTYCTFYNEMKQNLSPISYEFHQMNLQLSEFFQSEFESASRILQALASMKNLSEENRCSLRKTMQSFADVQPFYDNLGELTPFYGWLGSSVQSLKTSCCDIALQAKACIAKLDIDGFGAATDLLNSFKAVPFVADDICKHMDELNVTMSNRIDCLKGQVADAISTLEWRAIDKAFCGLKAALHLKVVVGRDLHQTYEELQTLLEHELKNMVAKIERCLNSYQIKDAHNDLKRFQRLLNSATVRETEYNKYMLMRLEQELQEVKQEVLSPRVLAGDLSKVQGCLAGFREVDLRLYQRQCMTLLDNIKKQVEDCSFQLSGGNRRAIKGLLNLIQELMLYEVILSGDVCVAEVKTYKDQLLGLLFDDLGKLDEEIQAALASGKWLEVERLTRHMEDAKQALQTCDQYDVAGRTLNKLNLERFGGIAKLIEQRGNEIVTKLELIRSFDLLESTSVGADVLGNLIEDVDSQLEFFQVKYGKVRGAEGLTTEKLVGQIKGKMRDCIKAVCACWEQKQFVTMKEIICRLQGLCNVPRTKLEASEVLSAVQQDLRQRLEGLAQDTTDSFRRGIETQHLDKSRSTRYFREANALFEDLQGLQRLFGCCRQICSEDLEHTTLVVMMECTDKEANAAERMFSCESGPQAQDVLQAVLKIWAIPSQINSVSLKQHARTRIANIFKKCKDLSKANVEHRINFVELASMLCEADVKGSEIVGDFKVFFESFLAAKFREATARMTPEDSIDKLCRLNDLNNGQRGVLKDCMDQFNLRFRFLRQTCTNVEGVVATILDGKELMLNNKNDVPFILAAIFAAWSILLSSESEDIWQSPHPVQILALLRILGVDEAHSTSSRSRNGLFEWMKNWRSSVKAHISRLFGQGQPESPDGKGHLVEIKTGEGKSLVLGALAAFFALLGFHVDCVCYSKYLSKRDYEKFQELFIAFGVYDRISYNTFSSLSRKLIDSRCDVRLATKQFLLGEESAQERAKAEPKRILLIDEVDVFFSKEFYGSIYSASSVIMNEHIAVIQQYIWQHRALPAMTIFEGLKSLEAYSALNQEFPHDFALIERHLNEMIHDVKCFDGPKHPYKVDEQGWIAYDTQDTTSSNLTFGYKTLFAHFKERQFGAITDERVKAATGLRIRCGNFSYAELPLHYEKIFGVTGTLQSLDDFEKEVVESEYKIKAKTITPSIFGDNKLKFREISDVTVEDDIQLYNRKIKEQILQAVHDGRAVLVFFQDETSMNAWLKSGYAEGVDNVSVVTTTSNTMNVDHYVRQATRCGAVTLFTAVHGRGLDFICHDRTIERNGGMHVLQTFLSCEYSEEIQIKGRTARNGKNGTFELVLYTGDLSHFGISREEIEAARMESKLYEMLNSRRKNRFRETGMIQQQLVWQARDCHIQSTMLQDLFVRHAEATVSDPTDAQVIATEIRALMLQLNEFPAQKCRLMCLSDATGSMSALWRSVKQHIETMLERIDELAGKGKIELKWVAYRDYDAAAKVTESSEWTHDLTVIRDFLNCVECYGGGDNLGEAVEAALQLVNAEEFPPTRVLLIGDEPPHPETAGSKVPGSDHVLTTDWKRESAVLAANGIPVHTFRVGSRETTAKAFQAIALATGGQAQDLNDSPDALLDAVCLNALEEVGGASLVKAYRSRYMDFSFTS